MNTAVVVKTRGQLGINWRDGDKNTRFVRKVGGSYAGYVDMYDEEEKTDVERKR